MPYLLLHEKNLHHAQKVTCTAKENIDPVDILKESQTCALEGERALDCGAAPSPGRHKSCCNGFSCTPGNVKVTCTSNENLPKGPTCGTEGIKATSCGAAPAADRPEGCCSGFVCHPGPQSRYCTDATNVTLPSIAEDGAICAAEGERAKACGATGASRPAECCRGMMCEFGAGVRCVVDPFAPTAKPTKAPTPVSPLCFCVVCGYGIINGLSPDIVLMMVFLPKFFFNISFAVAHTPAHPSSYQVSDCSAHRNSCLWCYLFDCRSEISAVWSCRHRWRR